MDRAPLETWIHEDGRLALLGDACHPMLPYAGQGVAMAIEDAAVLGNLFSRLSSRAQIAPLLHAYEAIRYERATKVQEFSRLIKTTLQLPDGLEQEQRDRKMRAAMDDALKKAHGEVPVGGTDTNDEKEAILYGYDADEEAEKWWRQRGESKIGPLRVPSTS